MIPRAKRALMKQQCVCGVIGGFLHGPFCRGRDHVMPQGPRAHNRAGLIALQSDQGVASVVQGTLQVFEVITMQLPVAAIDQDRPGIFGKRQ